MKTEFEEYRDTGMLGAYTPDHAVLREMDGGVSTVFRDSTCRIIDEGITFERGMLINGKSYFVTSVFPAESKSTPTEKLLSLIDADLTKVAHSA